MASDTGEWQGLGATWQLIWQVKRFLNFLPKNGLAPMLVTSAPCHL